MIARFIQQDFKKPRGAAISKLRLRITMSLDGYASRATRSDEHGTVACRYPDGLGGTCSVIGCPALLDKP